MTDEMKNTEGIEAGTPADREKRVCGAGRGGKPRGCGQGHCNGGRHHGHGQGRRCCEENDAP